MDSNSNLTLDVNAIAPVKGTTGALCNTNDSISLGENVNIKNASSCVAAGKDIKTASKTDGNYVSNSIALGSTITCNGSYGICIGNMLVQQPASEYNRFITIGQQNTTSPADETICLGYNVKAVNDKSVCIGSSSAANSYKRVCIGASSSAGDSSKSDNSESTGLNVVVGANSYTTGSNSNIVGSYSSTSRKNTSILGNNANVYADNGIAVGSSSSTSGISSITLGYMSSTGGDNCVALGSYSYAKDKETVSVGYGQSNTYGYPVTRRIVNVGTPTAGTDAATKAYVDSKTGITKIDLGISALSGSETIQLPELVCSVISNLSYSDFMYKSYYLTATDSDVELPNSVTWVAQSILSLAGGTDRQLNFEHMQGISLSDGSLPSICLDIAGTNVSIIPSGNIKANQYTKFKLVIKG